LAAKGLRRIGLVDAGSPGWTAGSAFVRTLASSVASAAEGSEIEVAVLSAARLDAAGGHARLVPLVPRRQLPGEARLRKLARRPPGLSPIRTARSHGISVLVLPFFVPRWTGGVAVIGWIPDFQHLHLPELFGDEERLRRDAEYRALAGRADLVLLSSRSVAADFAAFAPEHSAKARVLPFPSRFAFETVTAPNPPARQRFTLPPKFALVVGQLWRHKNHQLVLDALRALRARGVAVPVVIVGLPADYRDPANTVLSRLLQTIAEVPLRDQVTVLGLVSEANLLDLLRTAAVVIQPSRFEGWSTVVQDAQALGRPVVCSDIAVHREQAPAALGFFDPDRPDALAELLAAKWDGLPPGPDAAAEEDALAKERRFAREHGERLLALCREAYEAQRG
jgi:glycosyltransferase involved in cell wall biosynthesis